MDLDHVIDRHGRVWAIVRDAGMVTRADYGGATSADIFWLEKNRGPLVRFNGAEMYAREAAALTPTEEVEFIDELVEMDEAEQERVWRYLRDQVTG